MPSIMKGTLHAFYIYSCTGHFLHTVSFHFLEGESPLPDQLPGEHTNPPSHMRQYLLLSFGLSVQHSLRHSLIADRHKVAGHVPTDHTCSFMLPVT